MREVPFYSPRRSVPAIFNKESPVHRFLEDKIKSPAKPHLDGSQSGFGRPQGSADPWWHSPGSSFLWLAGRWALTLFLGCILLGAPVSYGLWARLVSGTQDWIIYAFLLRSLVFSFAFQLWVLADHDSPKLMELD